MTKAKSRISSMRTIFTFIKVGTCSEALINVIDRAFDNPMKFEEHAAMPLAGGIMQHGYQCGLIWGAALGAGAQAYQLFGPGPQAETMAVIASQRLVESFYARNNEINCLEITETDWNSSMQMFKNFLKGGPITCMRMAARFSHEAFSAINTSFLKKDIKPPCSPVSCAAMLAQKMGAKDMHMVMAAGLAGGIGLCGGACGALGAAIWLSEMNINKGDSFFAAKSRTNEIIDKFLKSSDFEFECSDIVGRKFENVSDHADYLHSGGCSKIIEALAAQ